MVAKQGLQEIAANGDKFIVLLNGTRHEGTPGQLDYKIVEFERYAMRVETGESKKNTLNPKAYRRYIYCRIAPAGIYQS